MNFRFVAITVVVASFFITLAIALWHQRGVRQYDQIAAAAAPTSVQEEPLAEASLGTSPTVSQQILPSSPPRDVHPTPPSEDNEKPQSFSQTEVPAFVLLGPITNRPEREATLRNSSARSLEISITASNPVTGHQASTRVTIAPGQHKSLNDEGFLVESGDLLTLHSPPFRDRESEVD